MKPASIPLAVIPKLNTTFELYSNWQDYDRVVNLCARVFEKEILKFSNACACLLGGMVSLEEMEYWWEKEHTIEALRRFLVANLTPTYLEAVEAGIHILWDLNKLFRTRLLARGKKDFIKNTWEYQQRRMKFALTTGTMGEFKILSDRLFEINSYLDECYVFELLAEVVPRSSTQMTPGECATLTGQRRSIDQAPAEIVELPTIDFYNSNALKKEDLTKNAGSYFKESFI
ncbi:hypothetical protein EDC01DRAFT_189061 [Geopyxis carbonaria]|nr:hypothetical protein EDC01DRAFT_189061 [Geopyxis carbonaria]